MGIARANKNFNSFINGIVTDANEFNAPENAVLDCENIDINNKGEAVRRLGLEETDAGGYQSFTNTLAIDSVVTASVAWPKAGLSVADLVAIQVGNELLVYRIDTDDPNNQYIDSVAITVSVSSESSPFKMFAGGDGHLYVFPTYSFAGLPQRISYDHIGGTITSVDLTPKVRDIEGVDDGLTVDERAGGPLTADHHYNLLNQGWTTGKINAYATTGYLTWVSGQAANTSTTVIPTTNNGYWYQCIVAGVAAGSEPTWPTTIGNTVLDGTVTWRCEGTLSFPSNAQQWFQGRDSSGNFSPAELNKLDFGAAPAPRGRYIFDVDDIDRDSIVTGATNDTITNLKIKAGAYYAGRIWYGGINLPRNRILYSQLIQINKNPHGHNSYEACYSNNDVTSEYFNELLDSDGGAIDIPDLGSVIDMRVIGSSLLILTRSGIWAVKGSFGESFRPSTFSVDKISPLKLSDSHLHIVEAEGSLYLCLKGGIYSITESTSPGSFVITSITENRFNEGYKSILSLVDDQIDYIRGHYDQTSRFIEWTYAGGVTASGSITLKDGDKYRHNWVLRYNLNTNAFSKYKLAESDYVGIAASAESLADIDNIHYLVRWYGSTTNIRLEWCKMTATDFKDYNGIISAIDAPSSLLPWPVHVGAPDKDKQAQYLTTYLRRTETQWTAADTFDSPSGLTATVWWDWYGTEGSTKKTGPHNVYRMLRLESDPGSYPTDLVYNKDIVVNRTKIRGKGNAYTIKFDSVAGKDFQFLGWTTPLIVETN